MSGLHLGLSSQLSLSSKSGGGAAAVIFSLAYVTTANDGNTLTTYTFSAQSFGTADANRTVIVGVAGRNGDPALDISSVTIGGVSATLVKKQINNASTATTVVGLYRAAVPTGTTGDVVVTFNEATLRCGIAIWKLVTATPLETATSASAVDPSVLDLTIPSGGAAVVFAAGSSSAAAYTPTGYTENTDQYVLPSTTFLYTAGTNTSSSGATTIRADCNPDPTDPAGVCAAWGS